MTYAGDPNTEHQVWSRWTFEVRECVRTVPHKEVELNAARWLRKGFGSVGKARVARTVTGWRIEAIVEGAPVQEPAYVAHVAQEFQQRFVEPGFGTLATSKVKAELLAGEDPAGRA